MLSVSAPQYECTASLLIIRFTAFVNINIIQIFSVGCIDGFDFHSELLVISVVPLVVMLVLAGGAMIYELVTKESARKRVLSLFLLFLWCIFPFVSVMIFRTFDCERFDNGDHLLKADFSISCDSDKHHSYTTFAGVMILVYPFGVPALFLASMWP